MIEYETLEHPSGLTVRICAEDDYFEDANPRTHDGQLGVMFCSHPTYRLGDRDAPDPRNRFVVCNRCHGEDECPACGGVGEFEVGIVDYLKREHGARVILPLFLYDHSGITMSAGDRLDNGGNFDRVGRFGGDPAGWDTSSVGVIFDTAETRKACGWENRSDQEIEADLQEAVRYYAAYLEGNVFAYEVRDAAGEVLDACGGMVDPDIHKDDSYVKQEALSAATACAEEIERERERVFEAACRDVVTVMTSERRSQSARDAEAAGYGGPRYWDYLDEAAQESHDYWLRRGDPERAREMFTRSLSEALRGNDGD